MARGKYRGTRNQDDYYLSDRDLEGGYIDEIVPGGAGGPVRFASGPEETGPDENGETEDPAPVRPAAAAPSPPVPGGGTLRQRLAVAIAPKPAGPRPARSPSRPPARTSGGAPARQTRGAVVVPEGKTLQDLVNNLDRRERTIALVAAALGVAFAIFLLIYYAHPAPHTKNAVNSTLVAGIIGGPSLLLGASVFVGRRALVGFMALFTGFAFLSFGQVTGLVYFGVGLWLILKAQRYARAAREEAGDVRPARRQRQDSAPSKPAALTKARRKTPRATTASKAPAASKRYTPPRGAAAAGRRGTAS